MTDIPTRTRFRRAPTELELSALRKILQRHHESAEYRAAVAKNQVKLHPWGALKGQDAIFESTGLETFRSWGKTMVAKLEDERQRERLEGRGDSRDTKEEASDVTGVEGTSDSSDAKAEAEERVESVYKGQSV